jgi:hypothetical protein
MRERVRANVSLGESKSEDRRRMRVSPMSEAAKERWKRRSKSL